MGTPKNGDTIHIHLFFSSNIICVWARNLGNEYCVPDFLNRYRLPMLAVVEEKKVLYKI